MVVVDDRLDDLGTVLPLPTRRAQILRCVCRGSLMMLLLMIMRMLVMAAVTVAAAVGHSGSRAGTGTLGGSLLGTEKRRLIIVIEIDGYKILF